MASLCSRARCCSWTAGRVGYDVRQRRVNNVTLSHHVFPCNNAVVSGVDEFIDHTLADALLIHGMIHVICMCLTCVTFLSILSVFFSFLHFILSFGGGPSGTRPIRTIRRAHLQHSVPIAQTVALHHQGPTTAHFNEANRRISGTNLSKCSPLPPHPMDPGQNLKFRNSP